MVGLERNQQDNDSDERNVVTMRVLRNQFSGENLDYWPAIGMIDILGGWKRLWKSILASNRKGENNYDTLYMYHGSHAHYTSTH